MGLPEAQIEMMRQMGLIQSLDQNMWWLILLPALAGVLYLLFIRHYSEPA